MASSGQPEKEPNKRPIPWFGLLRLTGIILFILIISRVDIQAIWVEIVKSDIWFITLALLLQLFMLVTKGIRWHLLNAIGTSVRLGYSFGEFFESYAIGVITPGRFGELLKAGYQNQRVNKIASMIKVGAERSLDFSLFILISGLALYFAEFIPNVSPVVGVVITFIGILILLLGIALFSSKKVNRFLDRFIPGFSETYIRRNTMNIIGIIFLSLLGNIFYFISCYIVAAYALELEITLAMLCGGIATAGLVNLIPITVMGLGTREMTFLYVFRTFPENIILAFSGLIFIVAQVGGGIVSLLLGQIFLHVQFSKESGLWIKWRKKNG